MWWCGCALVGLFPPGTFSFLVSVFGAPAPKFLGIVGLDLLLGIALSLSSFPVLWGVWAALGRHHGSGLV